MMKAFCISMGLLFLGLSMIIGCASTATIDLVYHPADVNVPSCKSSVAVVALEDQRSVAPNAVGQKKDGQNIYGKPFTAEWISRALLEELNLSGCKGEYHDKGTDFDTDYVVTWAVKEAYFKQESMSGYMADMKLRIVVNKGGEKVLGKEFTSTLRKKSLPSAAAYNKVLLELLQGMMREVVPDVREVIE
ncbi:MAG: hypothetical protein JSU83_21780 [Deltaproteobacteria bacterium]|nr:MAG: hypothetical protein JSU83_21780 [Deltaproteobacteria bacterium]